MALANLTLTLKANQFVPLYAKIVLMTKFVFHALILHYITYPLINRKYVSYVKLKIVNIALITHYQILNIIHTLLHILLFKIKIMMIW